MKTLIADKPIRQSPGVDKILLQFATNVGQHFPGKMGKKAYDLNANAFHDAMDGIEHSVRAIWEPKA